MSRLGDGGAVVALGGDEWTIVRLSEAGQELWDLELPWVDLSGGPGVDERSDGTFVVSLPTGLDACRVLHVSAEGQELAAIDQSFYCLSVTSLPDGGSAIGTRLTYAAGQRQAVILGADGTAVVDVVLEDCIEAAPRVAASEGLFMSDTVSDCDESGEAISGTGRPWAGLLDTT